jgi:hypothetical protein
VKLPYKILLTVLILIIAAEGIAYVFQHKFIFQSTPLTENYSFTFKQPYKEYFLRTADNEKLNVLWFTPDLPAKGIILYFHGNASNLQRWGEYAIDFTSLGYEVVMMDYRGYGKSSGYAEEQLLYDDALLLWNWIKEKSTHKQTIIYGRSLGSAIASELSAKVQPDMLILETPFDELRNARMARVFYFAIPPRYKFPTKEFLAGVHCKKILLHGTDDWVVPLSSAKNLKPLLSASDEFIIIEGGGHTNLREFERYHETLKRVLP